MDAMIDLLKAINSLTPLGAVGLCLFIIYLQVKGKQQVTNITDNHLHGLPDIIVALQRIEVKLGEEFAYIRARLNGK